MTWAVPKATGQRHWPDATSSLGLDPTERNPVINIVLIKANVLADLVEGDASLADKSSYEAFGRSEALGELRDAEHRTFDAASLNSGLSDHRVLLRTVIKADVESMPLRS